jgi:hypothetical protein
MTKLRDYYDQHPCAMSLDEHSEVYEFLISYVFDFLRNPNSTSGLLLTALWFNFLLVESV